MDSTDTDHDPDLPIGALSVDPIWRQAALDACTEFRYGDTIPHAWLFAHLQIVEPLGRVEADQWRKFGWELLRKVERFRDCMMAEHQRYLVNVRGTGYRIVEPKQQTGVAMNRLHRKIAGHVAEAMGALVHINEAMLTLENARENAEAKGKLGWFRTVAVKRLEAPKLDQAADSERAA